MIELAAERYAEDYQRRLIEKLASREFRAVPRGAGPLQRPLESSFSSLTLAHHGWGISFSMTRHGDPLLWAQRQELRDLTEARDLEIEDVLGIE